MKNQSFQPYHRPLIGPEEIQEVAEVLRSGWLTTGQRTHRFEDEFRMYTGARHALALNSCTAALHIALAALGIGPGDEVITTPLTFCATVNCIIHVGAKPVLADIGKDGNIDPGCIERRITSRTRAILPVHYGGLPCDLRAIWRLAKEHGLHVVEDAAHAAGTHYEKLHLGSLDGPGASDAVAYSFYATKNITTGEGGMVTCNNSELYERMRRLALHGINKDAWNRYADSGNWYYEVEEPGFKYNLSDIQSAIGIHQLRKLEGFLAERVRLAEEYKRLLADVPEVEVPQEAVAGRHAWHLFVIRLKLDALAISRDQFIRELRNRGVGTSVHFIPIPLHPFFQPWANDAEQQCPEALELYSRIISLPLYPGLQPGDVIRIADAVKDIVARNRLVPTMACGAMAS